MLENYFGERIVEREFGEHLFVGRRRPGGRLLDDGDLLLDEENFSKLLRTREIEGAARRIFSGLSKLLDFHAKLRGFVPQQLRVERDADGFHAVKNREERALNRIVDVR